MSKFENFDRHGVCGWPINSGYCQYCDVLVVQLTHKQGERDE